MTKRKFLITFVSIVVAIFMAVCLVFSACTIKIDVELSDNQEDNSDDGNTPPQDGGESSHVHVYDVLKYDENGHWYECECGEGGKFGGESHLTSETYKSDETAHWTECAVCGYVMNKSGHVTESNEYKTDDTSHWQVCDVCNAAYGTEGHSSSTYKTGTDAHWHECEVCGVTYGSTSHSESASYDYDETSHWKACEECGTVLGSTSQHVQSETYSSDSSSHWYICTVCGAKMSEETHDTSGENGACSKCGYIKADMTPTTVYMVGDSTMCSFNDTTYYYPRYGYGTQLANYLTEDIDENTGKAYVTVNNLAMSGRSSKSFLTESNYTTLTSEITAGDYLIIGFGHNDEKYDDDTRFTTPDLDAVDEEGSFQNSLYYNYVKVALDAGATPILCTPIVRANKNDNYSGSDGHVVTNYGDYSACIRDLAEDYNITCIDLTTLTTDLYTQIGYDEAIYYHAWTNSKAASVDTTHLNIYGAKEVSYLFATALQNTDCDLAAYVRDGIAAPTKDADLVVNPQYVESGYESPDFSNSDWISNKLGTYQGVDWYKTAFGDTGTGSPYGSSGGYEGGLDETNGKITVGQSGTARGKITSSSDGSAYVFTQFDVNQQFKIVATATIKTANNTDVSGTALSNQSGFGIMLRDDIYRPTQDATILTNYVASGVWLSSSSTGNVIYSREGNEPDDANTHVLTNTNQTLQSICKVGDEVKITLERYGGAQNTTCTFEYGNKTYTYSYYDFDYRASDAEYTYLCFYAARGTVVEFTDITLELGEIAVA